MEGWTILGKVALLLGCATVAGVLLRRMRQNAIVGYLLTGLALGPSGLGVFENAAELRVISELGVSLLLFSIGTEFSFRRLKELGRVATLGGFLQLAVTSGVVTAIGVAAGIPVLESLFLAFALSMSSTAVVMRLLVDRAELDSPQGRNATGMLLLQDVAVVPLLLIIDAWGRSGGSGVLSAQLGLRGIAILGFGAVLWFAMKSLPPRLLAGAFSSGSRELPVLAAACIAIFAAWGAHALGLSPALGAFLAGVLLAESPFATQVRADLTPLSSVFITVFFASIGGLVQLSFGRDLAIVAAASVLLVVTKFTIVALIVWSLQRSLRVAVSTGLALAQAGEFSFVLADQASGLGLIHGDRFSVLLAVSLVTLILTPYLIAAGPVLSARLIRRVPVRGPTRQETGQPRAGRERVVIVGFGPAGQRVAQTLQKLQVPFLVLDMNPHAVVAHHNSVAIELGDATQLDVLRQAGAGQAKAVVVTTPDPWTSALIVAQVKQVAPSVAVAVRARYHRYAQDLEAAGASAVVDEEETVGDELVERVLELLASGEPQANC